MDEKIIDRFEMLVEDELNKIVSKGDITPTEIENATKAVCLLHKIKHYEMDDEMYDEEYEDPGYSSRYYYNPRMIGRNSYERGRSRTTGRYTSRDNGTSQRGGNSYRNQNGDMVYSRKGNDEMMLEKLETMRSQASTEQERMAIEECIDKMMSL